MKKKFGMTFGGLQQKILNLVLIFVLAVIGVYSGVSLYQTNRLSKIVGDASSEQQAAISEVSGETMHQVVENTMIKATALQAYIANDMFADMKTDVLTLQSLAQGLFEHKDSFDPHPFSLPDKANDGTFAAQVLCEEGVDYASSEYLGVAAHMGDTMIAMCESSGYMSNCFIGLADGTLLCVDENSASKFDENGNIPAFAVRERPWYTGAVAAGELFFTGIEADTYTDKIGIECAAPIYVDGELIGVVGADLFLNAMVDYVNALGESAARTKEILPSAGCVYEKSVLEKIDNASGQINTLLGKLEEDTKKAEGIEDLLECAHMYHDTVLADMDELRAAVDSIEALIPDQYIPYPTYGEMLFSLR